MEGLLGELALPHVELPNAGDGVVLVDDGGGLALRLREHNVHKIGSGRDHLDPLEIVQRRHGFRARESTHREETERRKRRRRKRRRKEEEKRRREVKRKLRKTTWPSFFFFHFFSFVVYFFYKRIRMREQVGH